MTLTSLSLTFLILKMQMRLMSQICSVDVMRSFFGKGYRKMSGMIFNKQEFSPNRAIWG